MSPEDALRKEFEEVVEDGLAAEGAEEGMLVGRGSPGASVEEEREHSSVEEEEKKLLIRDSLGPQDAMEEGYKDISDFKVIVVQKEFDPYLQRILDHALNMCKDIPWNLRTTKVTLALHTTPT